MVAYVTRKMIDMFLQKKNKRKRSKYFSQKNSHLPYETKILLKICLFIIKSIKYANNTYLIFTKLYTTEDYQN